ncbi:MAG: hypothetical protein U5L04_09915 [Trueperaceae bacterium]|nr:hypothetical protein [Trueperaceae bacterium]
MLDALFDDRADDGAEDGTEDLAARLSLNGPVVALLPGTRRYAHTSLQLMMTALAAWPAATGLVAWVPDNVPEISGWTYRPCTCTNTATEPGLVGVFARGEQRVYLLRHRFVAVLRAANLVLGTAGTAHEQAAALGRPVVAFPLAPSYRADVFRNQKRLFRAALGAVEARPGSRWRHT